MRIAKVVGKLSVERVHPTLVGKRYVLVLPQTLLNLSGHSPADGDELVALDDIGTTTGDLIGISEGGEAAVPFLPLRKPVDVYNACILDELTLDDEEVRKLFGK